MKGIRATLLERAGRARSLDPDDVMETLADMLRDRPELIEELVPGMLLVKKPASYPERIRKMNLARKESLKKRIEERDAKVVPIIKRCLEKVPDISLREIGMVLTEKGIYPERSEKWSPSTILSIMRRAGIGGSPEA